MCARDWPNSGNLEFSCNQAMWLAYATHVVVKLGQLRTRSYSTTWIAFTVYCSYKYYIAL